MPRTGHVALAGRPNAGKSSLLNRLVGAHLAIVSPKAQSTRLPVVGVHTTPDIQLIADALAAERRHLARRPDLGRDSARHP